jgi:2-succinyl-6-hydroxy-2,4-cyclohexadiene-1-carboxylate synthase
VIQKELNYEVIGEGFPMIFIHGFLENKTMWNNALAYYAPKNKCVLIELFGHGDSPDYSEALTIEILAKKVLSVIHKEVNGNYSIVGHSLGGYVGLEILDIDTENVQQLILLNSHPWADSEEKKAERTRVAQIVQENKSLFIQQAIPNLFREQQGNKQIIADLIESAKRMSAKAISAATFAMRDREDRTIIMIANPQKVAVVQGENDHLIPAKRMEEFCITHDISYRLITGGDHMCWVDKSIYPLFL